MGKIKRASTALENAKGTLSGGWCKGEEAICRTKRAKAAQVPDRFCAVGSVYEALGAEWEVHKSWGGGLRAERVLDSCDERLALTTFLYLDKAVDQLADGPRATKLRRLARRAVNEATSLEGDIIVNFNDSDDTTKAMVVRAFDVAIELARKAEQRERQRVSRARRRQAVGA